VGAVDARVGADLLEMPCRFARVSPREQRLGEVQARVAAAAFGSGLEQLVEIVELGGRGGARQRLVQIGVAQVDRSQHELRLRPALGVERASASSSERAACS